MKVDIDLIQAKIDIIEQDISALKEIKEETNLKEFGKNYRDVLAAKHALQESIEACLDIANHIISTFGYRRPEDYKDMFRILMENHIIGKSFFEKIEKMAKFRNLLVHRYDEIEDKKLYRIIQDDLADIDEFVRIILTFLKKRKG